MKPWIAAAFSMLTLAACATAEAQQAGAQPSPDMAQRARESVARNMVDPSLLPRFFSVRVVTPDLERAGRFYSEVFGGRISQVFPGENAVSLPSGINLVLNQARPGAEASNSATAGFIIQVADIDATIGRVAAAGGTVVRPASPTPSQFGTRAAQIRDPDGVGIELIQFVPPPAQ